MSLTQGGTAGDPVGLTPGAWPRDGLRAATDAEVLAARLDAQARRQGAAWALRQLAEQIDQNFNRFDRIKPKEFAAALRKEAREYLEGSLEVPR